MKFRNVAILSPKNDHCQKINAKILDLIPGEAKSYTSVNRLVSENDSEILQFPVEFLDSLELTSLPPHKLTLKVRVIVMLLCNMNVAFGLLNGTRFNCEKDASKRTTFRNNNWGGIRPNNIASASGFITRKFNIAIFIQKATISSQVSFLHDYQ